MENNNLEIVDQLFNLQLRNKFDQKKTSHSYRKNKLIEFREALLNHFSDIENALVDDFGKARVETLTTEIMPLITMINFHVKNLKKWMKPKKVKSSLLFLGTKNTTVLEGKGNCLVISPWNYPFQLALYPVLTAFAAGNTVILKPSEFTPKTNKIISKLIKLVFSDKEVSVIEGEVEVSTKLLDKPFDHIFFTGSTKVGKVIMEAASKHLASVSLELGGKSPVLLDSSFDVETFAKRLVWGKFVNSGQTCVAPDYLIVERNRLDTCLKNLKISIRDFYGEDTFSNPDYAQIINKTNAERLNELIEDATSKGARISLGGNFDNVSRKIEPTILTDVTLDMKIMKEEIFGPILPILTVENKEDMLDVLSNFHNPLALYVFSNNKKWIKTIQNNSNSGGYVINETLLHVGHPNLPFGGAGKSGIGKYHSHHGFEELSNIRAVMYRKFEAGLSFFYPPFNIKIYKTLNFLLKKLNRFL